jgi:cytochrome P450
VSGKAWHEARHLLKPNFSRYHITEMLIPLESRVDCLLKSIPPGRAVDLQPLLLKMTMDTASEFLFGISTAEYSHGEAFGSAFEIAQAGMAVRARLGPINKVYTNGDFSKACALIHRYVDDLIKVALARRHNFEQGPKHSEEKYVFLYELANRVGEDPRALRYHVLNILVAGRDTTAGLISITLFLLARHKDIWHGLQEEVETLDGQHPTFEQIKQLKYLAHVLKEGAPCYSINLPRL